MRDYLRRLLSGRYEVTVVSNGEEAFSAALAQPPDLILSDVMMPQLDGFGLLAALRAQERTKTIPILLLSARAGEESRVEGLAAGADDYLVKPFTARELLARVEAHLSLARLREQAVAQLRQQWHTFDTALSHTPDLLCNFDLEGRFTYANRAMLALYQKSLEEVVGKDTFGLGYPPELAERLQRHIREVIDTRQNIQDSTAYAGASGETRTYDYIFAPVLSSSGEVEAVTCSARDITERKLIEQALASSKERLQQVFQQAPVAIVMFRGRDFVVELANPLYHALLPGREMAGRPFAEVVPEMGQEVWDVFHRVMDTGVPYVANDWHIPYDSDQDGLVEDHWFNVVYHPYREKDGSVSGFIAVLTDVTVQVLARKELERVNKELEQFAYVAGHDLQEPLRMVNIYSQLLVQRFGTGNKDEEEYAGFIQEGVMRMDALIRDLLTYSRTVLTDELPVGTADLSLSLREAQSVLQSRIEESGAVIRAQPLPEARGDTQQLAHVFQNLLSNALKYRKKGIPPEVHVSAEARGKQWQISVRDNGVGFEPQYAETIFGLFKRLHKDDAYPGTGLGLAICRRIVERYGGHIWAEGRPGEGATFHFTLPGKAGQ
jgi:PAS domain S-box-containing protein